MRRLYSLRLLACFLILALDFLVGCTKGRREPTSRPAVRNANVLLITLDTTRADHLDCYGELAKGKRSPASADRADSANGSNERKHAVGARLRTPNLDALAARGTRFANAIVQVPLTVPSHVCILTGTYPTANQVRGMGGFVLAASHPTIATILQSAGFQTGAVLGSGALNHIFGLAHGFSTYDDDIVEHPEGKLLGQFSAKRPASEVTQHAIAWLEKNGQHRFFLWVHYYDPHYPYTPPAPYKYLYAADPYSGEIAYMDEQVGKLLGWLYAHGLGDRTLVLAIGDHGEGLGEHGEKYHGIFLYDSTLHVPFIMAGPGVPAGKTAEEQVRSIDLMPTVLEFLGLAPGSEVQGVSLWPLIQYGRLVRSNYAYCETLFPRTFMGWSELRAMRTARRKLILAPHSELYDLESDPGEKANVIARYPVEARDLEAKIWEVAGRADKDKKLMTVALDPAKREELESLGYVNAGVLSEVRLGSEAPDPKDRVEVLNEVTDAEEMLAHGSFRRAAELMQKALMQDPANPGVHLYLATALQMLGRYPEAIQTYEHGIKMHLANDEIYSRLGKVYLRMNEVDKAIPVMVQAAELNPTDLDNLTRLGTAYMLVGRVTAAEKTFKAALAQSDQNAPAYNYLGLLAVQRGDITEAKQDFEKAIQIDSADLEPVYNLGVLYQKTGNNQQAIHYLRLFLQHASPQRYGPLLPKVRAAVRDLQAQ